MSSNGDTRLPDRNSAGEQPIRTAKLNGSGYIVPAPLVHRILWGIVVSIVSVGAYMVQWNLDDKEWKATLAGDVVAIKKDITKIETTIADVPKAEEQLEGIEKKLDRHLRRHDSRDFD